ncbi:DHH family phosphoesterase [Anaerococcus hydrogenalis]|uniref:Cyclic-di-AMP phosphodiesterase n=1 Tax=Anaerococcus hydrogenalis TaxID=33029 RepID=A0A2N6UJQ8_9FIRM|nr:DHH family phosphoesterase [Anaerococcus hydrogenalis]MDK7695029.1 DHH family phosphoesterase [Anaerococcus hydrogenalis]MDK7696996.1 DHH family phosphoesterase [Anaerococcus hydrogenalis]MDK7708056.1 DHH family phosphoesterase [Anaerococcus hydrogenalis]PMC81985.1 DHH family phosphoesterase [Anaerococcus hydrogenalis]
MKEKLKYFTRENYIFILALPLLISIILFFYEKIFATIGLILVALLYFYIKKIDENNEDFFQAYIDEMDYSFDEITKNVVFQMPFPIVILEEGKTIKWHNSNFKELFEAKNLIGKSINSFVPDFNDIDFTKESDKAISVNIYDKVYEFYYSTIKREKYGKELTFVYGIDNTSDENIKKIFKDRRLVVLSMYIDNYDDLRQSTKASDRSSLTGEIDKIIMNYFEQYGAMVRKYENDRYMVMIHYDDYVKIYESKFKILDLVREVKKGNSIEPTLSIGVGLSGSKPIDIYEESRVSIDIALSRGGDQVVIKEGDNYEYFGGKSKATEKISKVRSRVISQALKRMVENSSKVFVMGHNNPDMDSFGSALGIYEGIKSIGKDCYFVLNGINKPIENIYNRTIEDLEGFREDIVTEIKALEMMDQGSLVIVTDNHRKNSTEAPAILDKTDQIVIIDHHRRGNDYIRNATISYIEPYASSASELVTEILNYFDESFKARVPVAEALLAGLTVDTKNFVYQTGVRTFEAASILKRWGADSIIIKRMFKDDFQIVKYKSEVIADSTVVNDFIAIGHFNREMDGSTLIASQAADDLLNIKGVRASFVLTRSNDKIHISGRSLGDISVQLILERIGGGGHLTSAATQLDMSIEEAEIMLKKAIKEYLEEELEDYEDNTN